MSRRGHSPRPTPERTGATHTPRDGSGTARITFQRRQGGRFQIGPEALTIIRGYTQREPHQPEAGGVLLGRLVLGSDDVVIDAVTAPLPGDRQSRFRFYRARRRHQEMIERAWNESGGTCIYLGEWHTHPELRPSPSTIDWVNWRRKLLMDRYTGSLFFVIAGIDEIAVWEGGRCRPLARVTPVPA